MGMDALFTALTGMEANQQMLDVVGNNLANQNTTGFQAQQVNFSDLLYQTLSQASGPTAVTGGTDPVQAGTGVKVAGISTNLQQGTLQSTGNELNMALQGSGYFVVGNGSNTYYTRAGSFGIDANGYLIDPSTGDLLQRFGTVGEGGGNLPAFQTSGNNNILLPTSSEIPGAATTNVVLQGNLSASSTGPVAQVLTSTQAFTTAGGAPATAATLLDNLSQNATHYAANGDTLTLQGIDGNGNAVNVQVPVTAATTLGNVVSAINSNFQGVTASVNAGGDLVVQSNKTGASSLSVSIADTAGDTGATNWSNNSLSVSTAGAAGTTVQTSIQVFDAAGNAHTLNLSFQDQGNNTWNLTAGLNPGDGTVTTDTISGIKFNQNGSFSQITGANTALSMQFPGMSTQNISFSFGASGGFGGLTQLGGTSSAVATGQNGFAPGTLSSLSIAQDGTISGVFSNGQTLPIAQIAVASFANAGALNRVGNNYYTDSAGSGPPLIGAGQSGGRGSVMQQELESSNVDVSTEFTNLIIAQRGFEVNAHVLTAGDQMMQDLINTMR